MARRTIKGLSISRISLVDAGASFDSKTGDGAHFLIFKRATPADGDDTMTPEEILKAAAALTPEQKASLQKALGAAPAPEDILKGASPEVRALIEKQAADLKKAQDEAAAVKKTVDDLAKAARTASLRKRVDVYASLSGDKEALAHILGAVESGLGEDAAKKFEETLKGWDAQIKKGALAPAVGSRGTTESAEGDGSARAEVEKRATAIVTKDAKTTMADAIAEVFAADPGLYQRYHEETAGVGGNKDASAS